VLYTRLLRVRLYEEQAHENVRRAAAPKPAYKLGIIDKRPSDLLYDASRDANFYQQIVRMCEEIIKGDLEQSHLEETMRRYFLQVGWQLYNLDKLLVGISRFAAGIFNSDPKDKSSEIMALFFKEREKEEVTHNQEIQYRRSVEKLIREGDLYRITYVPDTKRVTVQLMTTEDSTLDNDELSSDARWSYYVSAYTMREPTEGVPFSRLRMPFMRRSLPSHVDGSNGDDYVRWISALQNHDGLVIRICANSYSMIYEPGSMDWFWRRMTLPSKGDGSVMNVEEAKRFFERERGAVAERRRDRFKRKFVNNPTWAHGLSKDEVDLENQRFRDWVGAPGAAAVSSGSVSPAGGEAVGVAAAPLSEPAPVPATAEESSGEAGQAEDSKMGGMEEGEQEEEKEEDKQGEEKEEDVKNESSEGDKEKEQQVLWR
ncbi:Transcriptional regulatory protein sin3, partial [Ascosphaera atra]